MRSECPYPQWPKKPAGFFGGYRPQRPPGRFSGVKTLYIEPGSPWENAYSETFISRLGDELLKREMFSSLLEAKVLVEEYSNHYNGERPHSALGYRTLLEFAASCKLERVQEVLTKELESLTALSQ